MAKRWLGNDPEQSYLQPVPACNSSNISSTGNSEVHTLTNCTKPQLSPNSSDRKIHLLSKVGFLAFLRLGTSIYSQLDSTGVQNTRKASPRRGWRRIVNLSAVTTLLILVVNISFAVVAHSKFDAEDGVGVIYFGNCDKVKRWNTTLHLLINVLATALLAASSYTMQCLNSPTRSEIDIAHREGLSLDVGLLSVKNFKYIRRWKTFTWLLLSLSTLPLHLLWNSTIIMTSGVNLFSYVIADKSFLEGAPYAIPSADPSDSRFCTESSNLTEVIRNIYDGYNAGNFTSLNAKDCFDHYMDGDGIAYRNLVMITDATASVLIGHCGYGYKEWNGSAIKAVDSGLAATGALALLDSGTHLPPFDKAAYLLAGREQSIKKGTWNIGSYTIQSCLSETVGVQKCRLQYVSYILYVVIICNLVKLVCMLAATYYLWDPEDPILATVGDAVVSFLRRKDNSTDGWCLLDFQNFQKLSCAKTKSKERRLKQIKQPIISSTRMGAMIAPPWNENESEKYEVSVYSRIPSARLISATSRRRWLWTMFICWIYLLAGFTFWIFSVASTNITMAAAMSSKFGAVNPDMLLGIDGASGSQLFFNIVLANSFQVALSTTYYLYNTLYTAQCGALEWASFARGKQKPLRVTWPRGQQRSTYYLQLPWRYAIPLTVMLGVMHFLVSESIFLARLVYYDPDGQPRTDLGFMTVGYSPPAVLTASCVALVLLLAQLFNAWQSLDNSIPAHGNKSAVISAICHADKDQNELDISQYMYLATESVEPDMTTKPLKWGVTRQPRRIVRSDGQTTFLGDYIPGHCTFSTQNVGRPEPGSRYL